jgi:hypothetical protein
MRQVISLLLLNLEKPFLAETLFAAIIVRRFLTFDVKL